MGVALISLLFFAILGEAEPGAAYADAFAMTLPACAALLLAAAILVRRLPRTPFEISNALVERLPGWSAGFAYSMFLMTGGRLGDGLVHDLVAHVIDRRLQRVREAPQAIGEFLAFHFRGAEADVAWLHYLMREALVFGNRPVPQEEERHAAVSAQVQEIRDRQAAGLLPADLDPGHLRLMGFALMNYPRMLPQITRMTTGMTPENPGFRRPLGGVAARRRLVARRGGAPQARRYRHARSRHAAAAGAVTLQRLTSTLRIAVVPSCTCFSAVCSAPLSFAGSSTRSPCRPKCEPSSE